MISIGPRVAYKHLTAATAVRSSPPPPRITSAEDEAAYDFSSLRNCYYAGDCVIPPRRLESPNYPRSFIKRRMREAPVKFRRALPLSLSPSRGRERRDTRANLV